MQNSCTTNNRPLFDYSSISTQVGWRDRFQHWGYRWGFGRMKAAINPGLYAVGTPDADSNILVSCNYKLSFDHLRASLQGQNLWILVIDTKGINVWCAAGKGTFGTKELVQRIGIHEIDKVISHRKIIVPQL